MNRKDQWMQSYPLSKQNSDIDLPGSLTLVSLAASCVMFAASLFHETQWISWSSDGSQSAVTEGWGTWAGWVAASSLVINACLVFKSQLDVDMRLVDQAFHVTALCASLTATFLAGQHWYELNHSTETPGSLNIARGLPVAFTASIIAAVMLALLLAISWKRTPTYR